MEISILGTNGFLSTAIAKYFSGERYSLHMYGRRRPESHQFSDFTKIDFLHNEINCNKLLKSNIIIYCAGAGIQSNLHEDVSCIYTLNTTTPTSICNQLQELGYKGIFITFGSVFELGVSPCFKYTTEEELLTSLLPAPNHYVVSKRMLSRYTCSVKHDFIHWHFIIPTIYGPEENKKRLIPYTINAICNNEKLSFTSGEQIRQYLFVDEVPIIINKAYHNQLPGGIYNIEGNETLSVKDIVTLIHHELKKDVPHDCFGTASREDAGMRYLALDGQKLQTAIKYAPQICITQVLHKY